MCLLFFWVVVPTVFAGKKGVGRLQIALSSIYAIMPRPKTQPKLRSVLLRHQGSYICMHCVSFGRRRAGIGRGRWWRRRKRRRRRSKHAALSLTTSRLTSPSPDTLSCSSSSSSSSSSLVVPFVPSHPPLTPSPSSLHSARAATTLTKPEPSHTRSLHSLPPPTTLTPPPTTRTPYRHKHTPNP